jgi:hypothetical protein
MRARRSRRDHRFPGSWHKRQKSRFSGAPRHSLEGGRMNNYRVYANACDFGIIEAATDQDARDMAAQMAGYRSEADMVARLESPSEMVVVIA